ncbi:MAG: ester cyclase, partial [Pseudomonadota bacterium]
VVEGMLADLHKFDPETFDSHGQTGADGYWAEDMMWYGPGGIGSNYRWSGFVKDHREKFLTAFPDRKGGNHYCRFADGDYAAISGWPSMTMTHQGPYLGIEPTGKALTLRVMDFYRCRHHATGHGHIAENWVCLDYMDLTAQMGRDLVAEANAMSPL